MVRPRGAVATCLGVSGLGWRGCGGRGSEIFPTDSTSLKFPAPARWGSGGIPQPARIPLQQAGGSCCRMTRGCRACMRGATGGQRGDGRPEGRPRRVLRSSGSLEEASSAADATGATDSAGESSPRPSHTRLHVDRHLDSAPQFRLRVGGGKGDLTTDARYNLLIELARATSTKGDYDNGGRSHDWFDGDEKIFTIPKARKLSAHPDSDVEELEQDLYKEVGYKRHISHIMVAAYIAKPVLKQGWVDPSDMWEHDGKIGIFRVAELVEQKNGRVKKDANGDTIYTRVPRKSGRETKRGPPEYEEGCATHPSGRFQPGWLRLVDCTMDGAFYHDLMKNDVLPAANKYFGKYAPQAAVQREGERSFRVTNQEDGAGGHGLGCGESTEHKAMAKLASKLGFDVETQSSGTPELNGLDLGFWWCLNPRVCQRYDEFREWVDKDTLLDLLFKVIGEEFWKIDPALIYPIFEHKVDMAKEIVRLGGGKVKKRAARWRLQAN